MEIFQKKRCFSLALVIALSLSCFALMVSPVDAATITVVNLDSDGEGLNDPTPVAPVGGNPGTTRGAQRLNVLQHAADIWGALLTSNVPILVGAEFNLLYCVSNMGMLGSAGAESFHSDFANAPLAGTWYVAALANSYAGVDLNPAKNDIGAQFNSDVGNTGCLENTGWYYGFDGKAGTCNGAPSTRCAFDSDCPGAVPGSCRDTYVDFARTALHELGHGLGFLDLVTGEDNGYCSGTPQYGCYTSADCQAPASGTCNLDNFCGETLLGLDDAYMVHLEDHVIGKTFSTMTVVERCTAVTDTGNLHWIGTNALSMVGTLSAGISNGHIRMYAPSPYEGGSSVSHFDTVVSPNDLMEPYHNNDATLDLTLAAMEDIGWVLSAVLPPVPYALPDTGQTSCYDENGNLLGGTGLCPPPGDPLAQDGSYPINPLAYTDNGDETVTDRNTGLMWQKTNDATGYNWYEAAGVVDATANPAPATDVCGSAATGGHADWRLPTRRELLGILDLGENLFAIKIPDLGLNDPGNVQYFWTGDEYLPSGGASAWIVDFWDGFSIPVAKDDSLGALVRCVRGDTLSGGHFTDQGNGTVLDDVTGFVWQQAGGGVCSTNPAIACDQDGECPSAGTCDGLTWAEALDRCESLTLAGKSDWRLPNAKELETIVDLNRQDPALDPLFSLGAPDGGGATYYWTSTTVDSAVTAAWVVEFTQIDGSVDDLSDKVLDPSYARCVRGGTEIFNLVVEYYRDVLDRNPEPGGAESWTGEINRVVADGIDVKEGFIALARFFFQSSEYILKNKSDAAYITDLYETFLQRTPSAGEVAAWQAYLDQGLTRGMLLNNFAYSAEFGLYMQGLFGTTATRAEYNLVNDFYRGLLSRLPDSGGFNSWVIQMQAAQCSGAQAVRDAAEAEARAFAQGAEYALLARTDAEYVEDLYNAFLRRGADPGGFQYWVNSLAGGTDTRESVLVQFVNSAEFQFTVQRVIDAGCAL